MWTMQAIFSLKQYLLHIRQRLTDELEDIGSCAHKDEQQLGHFISGDPSSNW